MGKKQRVMMVNPARVGAGFIYVWADARTLERTRFSREPEVIEATFASSGSEDCVSRKNATDSAQDDEVLLLSERDIKGYLRGASEWSGWRYLAR